FHGHVFHGYYGRLATALFLAVERVLARFTDAIIVLSPLLRDEIHGRYRIGRAEQFVIIPLGLDLAPYDSAPPPPPHVGFVLATAVGGVPDLLGDDRGVLVPPGDVRAFVAALSRLAGDAALRARLAAAGRAFVRERYAKERLVRDIRELYERLLR